MCRNDIWFAIDLRSLFGGWLAIDRISEDDENEYDDHTKTMRTERQSIVSEPINQIRNRIHRVPEYAINNSTNIRQFGLVVDRGKHVSNQCDQYGGDRQSSLKQSQWERDDVDAIRPIVINVFSNQTSAPTWKNK